MSHETALYNSGDTVTLNAFELKKTPVTVAEFEKCVLAKKCTSEHYLPYSGEEFEEQHNWRCNYSRGDDWLNHPMNCVDWDGAREYCAWIGGRLPTEEEWEYAATHNGSEHLNTSYPWGNSEPVHCQTANYSSLQSPMFCDGKTENSWRVGTSAVGTYSPAGDSPLGLVDMAGNVEEWTASLYSSESKYYTLKGGSWDNNGCYHCLVSQRTWTSSSGREDSDLGFRCAK